MCHFMQFLLCSPTVVSFGNFTVADLFVLAAISVSFIRIDWQH